MIFLGQLKIIIPGDLKLHIFRWSELSRAGGGRQKATGACQAVSRGWRHDEDHDDDDHDHNDHDDDDYDHDDADNNDLNVLLQASRRMGDPRHMSLHPMPGVQQAHQQATLQVMMMVTVMTMMTEIVMTIMTVNMAIMMMKVSMLIMRKMIMMVMMMTVMMMTVTMIIVMMIMIIGMIPDLNNCFQPSQTAFCS